MEKLPTRPRRPSKRVRERKGPRRLYQIFLGSPNTPARTFTPKNVKAVRTTILQYFPSFSIFEGMGTYEKTEESSFLILISITRGECVEPLAHELKQNLNQEMVLLTDLGGSTVAI